MDRDYAPSTDDDREVELDDIDSPPPPTIDPGERLETEPDSGPGLDDDRRV